MLMLIWGLFNLAALVGAFALSVKATKYIRAKLGLTAAVVFVLFLLSSFSGSGGRDENLEPSSNQIKTWNFLPKDSTAQGTIYSTEKIIAEETAEKYNVGVQYVVDEKTKSAVPVSAYSENTGFIFGTAWQPMDIRFNKTLDPNLFRFDVDGIVKWKLLGITLYKQDKHYDGVVSLKDDRQNLFL